MNDLDALLDLLDRKERAKLCREIEGASPAVKKAVVRQWLVERECPAETYEPCQACPDEKWFACVLMP